MSLPEFDVLVDMARNDPSGLEQLRERLTREVIDEARDDSARSRLRGLACRIEMERRRSGSPLGCAIRLSEMMCQSLSDLQRSILEPAALRAEQTPAPEPAEGSNVLAFPRPR